MNTGSGLLGNNLFAYCENNPVNEADPSGHFGIGTVIGIGIGGLIGGIGGAITVAVKGKSITAGAVTGALAGAAIGWICGAVADAIATGGLSLLVGAAIASIACGITAAVANTSNQYWNYANEKNTQSRSSSQSKGFSNTNDKTATSSNGRIASECDSFAEYVDTKSILISGITAAIIAPLGVGANCVVNSAFAGLTTGGMNIVAKVVANFAMGGNVSMIQSIIDLF